MGILPLGIVADDLTGAMDTSGVFASHGLKSLVVLTPHTEIEPQSFHTVCYNTQSRFAIELDAVGLVKAAVGNLVNSGCERLYKKIDSTLRGHVGAEILSMMHEAGARLAFVCPAFPAMGRTVIDGVAHVRGLPLSETQEGSDVFKDMVTPSVTNLLMKQSSLEAGLVDLSYFESPSCIESRIIELKSDGCELIVFDAASDEHLVMILNATNRWRNESILVGSAGLASTIALAVRGENEKRRAQPSPPKTSARPIVVISGSLNEITQTQLDALGILPNVRRVHMISSQLLGDVPAWKAEEERVIENARAALTSGDDVVIAWGDPGALERRLVASSESSWMVERINSAIDSMITAIVEESEISGLILVGGETAYAVLKSLEAGMIEVQGEVQSGVPYGMISGGKADGKMVITKAGGFGTETTLVNTVKFARELQSR